MNICVFDTETTSLNKPFAYNIGYTILNENGEIQIKGFDDVDDKEPGLQVYCLRCGTKFTVPNKLQ